MTQSTTPSTQPAAGEPDTTESTIMIVDDNAQNVELLQAYLEALPCKTVTAFDGVEAMNQLTADDAQMPDLILLDIMMPKLSGFEVCRRIKEDPRLSAVPIIMVTALNELGDIERGVESGADDFLTKPVNKLELITRVRSLLRVRHLKRELDRTMAYIQDIESRSDDNQNPRGSSGQIDPGPLA